MEEVGGACSSAFLGAVMWQLLSFWLCRRQKLRGRMRRGRRRRRRDRQDRVSRVRDRCRIRCVSEMSVADV